MIHDHILQSGAASRESGAALRALINAGKAWIIAYHERVAIAKAHLTRGAPKSETS